MSEAGKTEHLERWFRWITLGIVVCGIGLRAAELLQRSLEYDEIWSFQYYTPLSLAGIFADQSTPNNHIVNTLLMKCSIMVFGPSFFAIRLPAFLFGAGVLGLSVFLAGKRLRDPLAVTFVAAAVAFNSWMIQYSTVARGYSAQLFFLLLLGTGLFLHRRGRWYLPLGTLGAMLACVAISSGLVWVSAIYGGFLLGCVNWRRWERVRPIAVSFGCFLGFAVIWYGCYYTQLRSAQSFGAQLDSPAKFGEFLWETIRQLEVVLWLGTALLLVPTAHGRDRRTVWFALGTVGLVLLSALVTRAGMVRVYQGVVPLAALGCAAAVSGATARQRWRKLRPFALALLAFPLVQGGGVDSIRPFDPAVLAASLRLDPAADAELVAYTAVDSYPVAFNDPATVEEYRLRLGAGTLHSLLAVNSPKGIEGFRDGSTVVVPVDGYRREPVATTVPAVALYRYPLKPLSPEESVRGEPLLMTCAGVPEARLRQLPGRDGWAFLNLHYGLLRSVSGGLPEITGAFLTPAATAESGFYRQLSQSSGNRIRFYRFETER